MDGQHGGRPKRRTKEKKRRREEGFMGSVSFEPESGMRSSGS